MPIKFVDQDFFIFYTEREIAIRLINLRTAGNKENAQGGMGKVTESDMGWW